MFSAFFIHRPKFAMVISLTIMLAGGMCYFSLPVAEYPEIAPPTIVVSTVYPGAGAQDIANTVAAPLEEQVNGIEGLLYYSSTSSNNGTYSLSLVFDPNIDPDIALVNVNNAIKRAEPLLPREVVMIGLPIRKQTADFLGVMAFSSSNPDHTPLFLSNYVSRNISDAMSRIPGVGNVTIFGEKRYSMRVWLDPTRLQYFGISQDEVQAAIRGQNIQAATGAVGAEYSSDYMQFKVETRGRLRDVAEFADIVIRSADRGRIVRLSDIADVELGSEVYGGNSKFNGNPAVMVAVFKLSNSNALNIVKDIDKFLKTAEESFPEGMKWTMAYDSTLFVKEAMHEIQFTLILTFSLVMLITYLFLQDWRATLVPMVAIPVSLIGTFAFMQIIGLTMNTLTMFGLILAIGLVVDDAIIVVECCKRLIDEEGLSPRDAAFQAMHELSGALVAATLVVVAVFAPIAFFGGMVGTIYKQFAITMCVALCLSLVVALTLSPAMCALILRKAKDPWGPYKFFNLGLDFMRNGYLSIGGLLARKTIIPVLLISGILFANYKLFSILPTAFVPSEDKGAIFGELLLPQGAAVSRTQDVMDGFVRQLSQLPGVRNTIAIPGFSMISGDGENIGMMIFSLDEWGKRTTPETNIDTIVAEVGKNGFLLPDGMAFGFNPPPIQGLGMSSEVTFALQARGGQTSQELAEAAELLIEKLVQTGKTIGQPRTTFDVRTPMLYLEVDRAKAEAMNVPVGAIFGTLQTQLGSMYVNDFNLYGKTYKVKLQSQSGYRENLNDIGQLTVQSRNGAMVPIDTLATVKWTLGPRRVERFNMFPSAGVRVANAPQVSTSELMETIKQTVAENLSNDYQIAWTDLSYQESQNEGRIIYIIALALVFAYLFLVAQYESWTTPVSVLLSVATGTAGSMAVLLYLNRSFDIYSQLGMLMLISLIAKTVILMVEYSKKLRDQGLDLREAAVNGLKVRYRAVLMTALALILGLFPMVIATGAGAASRRSIGVTAFWGMVIATVIGIMLVPGLYVFTRAMSETTKKVVARLFGSTKSIEANPSKRQES
ncbi:MAG: efflux RND transporter permease subunit [Planctomycetaceae bacterium]|nr:efflux RND transporter permease subunit [Planctomycetaceae bacterium]